MNNYEPGEIAPGEYLEWKKSLADYSAGDGWVLVYYFRNASGTGFDAAGTPDGNSWVVSADVPANAEPGRIDWEAWATKTGEEHLVGEGVATVKPSLKTLGVNAEYDGRSQAERDLEAVRKALVPETALSVAEYEIGGVGSSRRTSYYSKSELLALETRLAQQVNRERRAAAHSRGASYFKNIRQG
jgi:hypothetical protein